MKTFKTLKYARSTPKQYMILAGLILLAVTLFVTTRHILFPVEKIDNQNVATLAAKNPFAGAKYYVTPNSNAHRQIEQWRNSRPEDAKQMEKIAYTPTARWFGDWNPNIRTDVNNYVTTLTSQGALPVMLAYNIPNRDCGSYSAGGAGSLAEYQRWIDGFASGIGNRKAVVVVEPDALGHLHCTPDKAESISAIRYAVDKFSSNTNTFVYIDVGSWVEPQEMANRLKQVNVHKARGIATNVSNFATTATLTSHIRSINGHLDKPAYGLIDTSRNGQGPAPDDQWCNPAGRGLGKPATSQTGDNLIDGLFWLKAPGESDGTCNGGPGAGQWWPEYALGLAKRANFSLGTTTQPVTSPTNPAPAPITEQNFTSAVNASSTNVAPGSNVRLTTSVKSTVKADSVNILVEVYDADNKSVLKRAYEKVSISANETKKYSTDFQIPSSNASSRYTVKIGVFSSNWQTNHHWNDKAAEISVSQPVAAPSLTSSVSLSHSSPIAPGTKIKITGTVKSATALQSANIVIDVVDANGNIKLNSGSKNISFSANETKNFTAEYTIPYSGFTKDYAVKIGVFNSDWSTAYHWNDKATGFSVQAQTSTPQTLKFSDATRFDPSKVSPGQKVALSTAITSNMNVGPVNIVVDIYDSNGSKVLNRSAMNLQFNASQAKSFTYYYTIPWWPTECYTAKVGIFSADWKKVHHWNDNASRICR